MLSAPVSITDLVRELGIAPKLPIRPHRVAVVLTTRVTGDLRLLRILAIDSGTISAHLVCVAGRGMPTAPGGFILQR